MRRLIGLVLRRYFQAPLELQNRIATVDRPRREHAINIAVRVGLRCRREQQKIFARGYLEFRGRYRIAIHTIYSITRARISASGTKHSSYFPKIR